MAHGVGYFDKSFGNFLPDDPVFTCDSCGCTIEDEDSIPDVPGRTLCLSCFEDEYSVCAYCGSYKFTEDLVELDGQLICEDCKDEIS